MGRKQALFSVSAFAEMEKRSAGYIPAPFLPLTKTVIRRFVDYSVFNGLSETLLLWVRRFGRGAFLKKVIVGNRVDNVYLM